MALSNPASKRKGPSIKAANDFSADPPVFPCMMEVRAHLTHYERGPCSQYEVFLPYLPLHRQRVTLRRTG